MVIPSKVSEFSALGYWRVSRAHRTTVATKQFEVENSRIEIKTGESGLKRRRLLLSAWKFDANDEATIYVGGSAVTIGNGFPLYPRDQLELSIDGSVGVYAVADVAGEETSRLTIMELE